MHGTGFEIRWTARRVHRLSISPSGPVMPCRGVSLVVLVLPQNVGILPSTHLVYILIRVASLVLPPTEVPCLGLSQLCAFSFELGLADRSCLPIAFLVSSASDSPSCRLRALFRSFSWWSWSFLGLSWAWVISPCLGRAFSFCPNASLACLGASRLERFRRQAAPRRQAVGYYQ